ncbi:MAG: lyase family protein [Polyangiaceae bacterium]
MSGHRPLWDKGYDPDRVALAFTSRDDHLLDRQLLPWDLIASKAHVRGLARAGALPDAEATRLVAALEELEVEVRAGRFTVEAFHEDGHSAIEAALVERLGETGKRVHLGRSRNDQVLVATRLFERASLDRMRALSIELASAFLDRAAEGRDLAMPGYTHLQRAMPQNVGHWAAAFAEGLLDAASSLASARALANKSPLGAAAGYGVNLPLDRDGVARELGFEAVDVNPLWSQSSRGLSEVVMLTSVWHALAVVRRFAWDASLFTTSEFGFIALPESLTTGSSIMPQKRNPDVVELLRASCSVVQGAITELMGLVSLPAGYHRDLQLTKAPPPRARRGRGRARRLARRRARHAVRARAHGRRREQRHARNRSRGRSGEERRALPRGLSTDRRRRSQRPARERQRLGRRCRGEPARPRLARRGRQPRARPARRARRPRARRPARAGAVTADTRVTVTIVNGPRHGERAVVPITRFDEHFVYVELFGEERRFSRHTGFELKGGAAWSTWRLSGADHRRWKVEE